MRTSLDARIAALETAGGASTEGRCGVVTMLQGETAEAALRRVGPGNWLMVPGVLDTVAWQALMQEPHRKG